MVEIKEKESMQKEENDLGDSIIIEIEQNKLQEQQLRQSSEQDKQLRQQLNQGKNLEKIKHEDVMQEQAKGKIDFADIDAEQNFKLQEETQKKADNGNNIFANLSSEEKKILVKNELLYSNNSLVIYLNNTLKKHRQKGVKALISILDADNNALKNSYVADKVVGKAAALILVDSKAKYVYAKTISLHAIKVFKENNIKFDCYEVVPYINNKENSGMCDLEKLCLDITNPQEAHQKIKQYLEKI